MASRKFNKKSKKIFSKLWYGLLAIITAAVVILILELTNTTHIFHQASNVAAPPKSITHLPLQPAPTTKTQSSNVPVAQGTVTDENGKVPTSGVPTNPNQWAVSASGAVVVKLPTKNTTFQSGDTVSGTSSAGDVQYRLIDNKVGVIATGQLNVVNNIFTATINFTPHGSGGQLDVYTSVGAGPETNEVQIPINF